MLVYIVYGIVNLLCDAIAYWTTQQNYLIVIEPEFAQFCLQASSLYSHLSNQSTFQRDHTCKKK